MSNINKERWSSELKFKKKKKKEYTLVGCVLLPTKGLEKYFLSVRVQEAEGQTNWNRNMLCMHLFF